MSIKRFNKLIKDLGYFITIFYTPTQVLKVYFNEDSKPISMDEIRLRYINYCKAHNVSPECDFYLTAELPTYKVYK